MQRGMVEMQAHSYSSCASFFLFISEFKMYRGDLVGKNFLLSWFY